MKKPCNQLPQLLAFSIACGFFCASAQAAPPPYITSGTTDPASLAYGEAHFSAGAPIVTTASGNDGEAFWRLHTGPFPGDSGSGYYHFHPDVSVFTDPSGWTLTYRAKVNNADRNFESYVAVVDANSHAFILTFVGGPSAGASDVGMKYFQTGQEGAFPALATPLLGSSDPSVGYHTYQISYNPSSTVASFYIDGQFAGAQAEADTIFGGGVGTPRVEWGDGQGTGPATGSETQWSLLSLDIGQVPNVPEPSSIALVGLGGSLFTFSFLRRRNKRI